MANEKAIDKKPSFEEEAAAGEFSYFALEDKEDNRLALYSYIGAVIVHIILFFVTIPSIARDITAEKKKPKVFVIQNVRFKPPPPKQEQQITKPKAKKVPIPDPTPDEPEPIRIPQPEDLEIPDVDDLVIAVPDAPPPEHPQFVFLHRLWSPWRQ